MGKIFTVRGPAGNANFNIIQVSDPISNAQQVGPKGPSSQHRAGMYGVAHARSTSRDVTLQGAVQLLSNDFNFLKITMSSAITAHKELLLPVCGRARE